MLDLPVSYGGTNTDGDLNAALAQLEAASVEVEGATRVLLDDPDSIWLVTHGQVDLFPSSCARADRPVSRRFLWNATGPALLLGMAAAPGDREFGMLAVASNGARLRRVPMDALRALAARPDTAGAAIALIEAFVGHASAAIGNTAQPVAVSR